jgi:DNA-binding winged helix-turn-helix (wHTH) protein/tetratricopeptide (TPR) repeat protein
MGNWKQDDPKAPAVRLAAEADFHLGRFEMRPSSREIGLDGNFQAVEPRIAQVLVVLAKASGQIVSREELIDRCWGGRIVSESALNRVISRIRKLSNLDSEASFRLETIAKVGYRIIVCPAMQPAPVVCDMKPLPLPLTQVAVEAEATVPPMGMFAPARRGLVLGVGAGAIVTCFGVASLMWPNPKAAQVKELLAQSEVAMRMGMPDGDLQGIGFLQQAVALQPDNARAWGRLALAQTIIAEYAAPPQAQTATLASQEAARRALALDRRQIDALSALALLPPYYGDWLNAERRMDAVLAVDPHHLTTLNARDFLLVAVGRAREGALNRLVYAPGQPLDAYLQQCLVYSHWILGEIDKAVMVADRALQLWPKHPGLWMARLWVLGFSGRADRAVKYLNAADYRPDFPAWLIETLSLSMKAIDTHRPQNITDATDAILRTLELGPSQSVIAIMILCGLGEPGRAFDVANAYLLERGALFASLNWKQGQPSVNDQHHRKTNMLFVPVSANMRSDERFGPLAKSIGLEAYWHAAGVTPDFLHNKA